MPTPSEEAVPSTCGAVLERKNDANSSSLRHRNRLYMLEQKTKWEEKRKLGHRDERRAFNALAHFLHRPQSQPRCDALRYQTAVGVRLCAVDERGKGLFFFAFAYVYFLGLQGAVARSCLNGSGVMGHGDSFVSWHGEPVALGQDSEAVEHKSDKNMGLISVQPTRVGRRNRTVLIMNIRNSVMARQLKEKQLWIGLVEVRSLNKENEILDDTKGEFVNIVTWVSNAETVSGGLGGLFVSEVAAPEPVEARRARCVAFDEEIENMISRA